VDLQTGQLFAYEALVRCTVARYASPFGLFERAAVEGVCGRLGRRIRESAFARCPTHNLFVNLHPHELSERWLVRPDDPICYHDAQVFLEITESATLEYFDLCLSVLKEVCARTGAHLVVDDLGAGYSNLMRVIDLEPEVVKLDRALVTGVDQHPRKQKLVQSMVNMCVELGAKVVAEGIETADELEAVRDMGVHYGQGYFLARPSFPPPAVSWPYSETAR
jgi:EAL domain-containing protein (putative c-di-GMP-specific phosphodiesterase class I)